MENLLSGSIFLQCYFSHKIMLGRSAILFSKVTVYPVGIFSL